MIHNTAQLGDSLPHCSSAPSGHSCSPLQSQATGMHLPPHAACLVAWHCISSALDDQEAKPSVFLASLGPGDLFMISWSQCSLWKAFLTTTEENASEFSTLKTHAISPVMILGDRSFWFCGVLLEGCHSPPRCPVRMAQICTCALTRYDYFLQVWFGLKNSRYEELQI